MVHDGRAMRTRDSAPPILFQRPKLTLTVREAAGELGVSVP